ncbi:MAG: T9SS type A sorting domain-containing protein [candidate division WOR-3 bacterium]
MNVTKKMIGVKGIKVFILLLSSISTLFPWIYRKSFSSAIVNAMCIDGNGNIYLTGSGNSDLIAISVDINGNERWVKIIDGYGYFDEGTDIVYKNNAVYITGYFMNGYTSAWIVIKLDATNGNIIWQKVVHDYVFGCGYSIVCDDQYVYTVGNAYVSGTPSGGRFAVYKLNQSDGNIVANYIHKHNPTHYLGEAYDIIYGADGNLYVAGTMEGTYTGPDFTVISLNTDLSLRWDRITGTSEENEYATSIVYDITSPNFVWAIGSSHNPELTGDWLYQRLRASDGFPLVNGRLGNDCAIGYEDDAASDVDCDNYGNAYISGVCKSLYDCNTMDLMVVKLGGNNLLWNYSPNLPLGHDMAGEIVYANNAVFVAGGLCVRGERPSFAVICLDASTGQENWNYIYDPNPNGLGDHCQCVSYFNEYVFAAGIEDNDVALISLSPLGEDSPPHYKKNEEKNLLTLLPISSIINNKLNIKFIGFSEYPVHVSLYNSSGKLLYSQKFPFNSHIIIEEKEIKKIGKGIYFLKIKCGNKKWENKIIKE